VPKKKSLSLSAIDRDQDERISSDGVMSFHMTGCTGHEPATHAAAVANAMRKQDASFLYHLGDISYDDSEEHNRHHMYNRQLLAPYADYPQQIVAIPGNHDGKASPQHKKSAVHAFLGAFCADPAKWPAKWKRNTTDDRPAMIQPYMYWRFDTPLAYFIGLNANISNGGMLDDPAKYWDFTKGPQFKWLVSQLMKVKKRNAALPAASKRAVFVTVHYPPYSGATNFNVRGDPRVGETPKQARAPYLADALQQAFAKSGQRADVIFSAHAHLFQRLTYTYADGTVMPCLIVGNGGHSIEQLFEECNGSAGQVKTVPFPAVAPESFSLPAGDCAIVEAYEDKSAEAAPGSTKGDEYGFIRVTVEQRVLTCTYWNASGVAGDSFSLNLDTHRYVAH
jgi:hypothetical protein